MDFSVVLAAVASYLMGSVDFGVIVPRLRGRDIYSEGSGNPGASNVLRTMGRQWAIVVVLGDLSKGLAAAAIGDVIGGDAVSAACGFAAVVGHCYPIWHRFRGGKGVATTGGAMLWVALPVALIGLAAWIAIVVFTKRASVASMVAALSLTPVSALFGARAWELVWIGAMSALMLLRHWPNVLRLIRGEENTIEVGK